MNVSSRLGYFHIGESPRGYLGTGNIFLRNMWRALARMEYSVPLVFESFSNVIVSPFVTEALAIWRNQWEEGEDVAKHALAFIQSVWLVAHTSQKLGRFHGMEKHNLFSYLEMLIAECPMRIPTSRCIPCVFHSIICKVSICSKLDKYEYGCSSILESARSPLDYPPGFAYGKAYVELYMYKYMFVCVFVCLLDIFEDSILQFSSIRVISVF